jgi:hypothetical protein
MNLWEEMVDLQANANPRVQVDPQVAEDLHEEVEVNFRLEAQVCLLMFPGQVPLGTHGAHHDIHN